MPKFRITAPDGTNYDLTAPENATPDQVQAQANRILQSHQAKAPQQAPMGPIGRAIGEAGHGIYRAGEEALQSIPQAAQTALATPGQLISDVAALAQSPQTAIPEQAQRAAQFALRTVPESLRRANPLLRAASVATGVGDPAPLNIGGMAHDIASFGLSQRMGQMLPPLMTRAAQFITREAPGAAVELHSLAIPDARKIPETIRPSTAAKNAAYAKLGTMGAPTLWMGRFRSRLSSLIKEEEALANPDRGFISTLQNYLKDTEQGWGFDKVQAEAQRLGAGYGQITPNIGATPTETTRGMARIRNRQLKGLIASLHEDVGNEQPSVVVKPAVPPSRTYQLGKGYGGQWVDIPGQPAVYGPGTAVPTGIAGEWNKATRMAKREFSANGLAKTIEKGITTTGDQFQSLNVNRPIAEIRKAQRLAGLGDKQAQLFVNGFEPGELDGIVDTLKDIGRHLPRIPPGKGVNVGSYGRWKTAAAGEAIGELAGIHPMIGGAAGILGHDLIAQAMMSEPGRALVRTMMQIDPKVGPAFSNTLAAFLRTQTDDLRGAPAPEEQQQQPSFDQMPPQQKMQVLTQAKEAATLKGEQPEAKEH